MDPLGIIRLFLVIVLLSSTTNSSNSCTIFMHRGKNPPKRKKAIEDGLSKRKKMEELKIVQSRTLGASNSILHKIRSKKKLIVDC
jgi:hypothetical protein